MATFHILPWVSVTIFAALLCRRYWRLRQIPGPFIASFTDLWRFFYQNTTNFTVCLTQLHSTYGHFVRVGPNTVSVSDPSAIGTIYSMHGEFPKADSYQCLRKRVNGQVRGSFIDMQDEALVSGLRRAVGSAFAVKNLLDYEHDVDVTLASLIDRIRESRVVDVFQTLQHFQMDFLLKIAFSKEARYLKSQENVSGMSFDARYRHWMQWQAMPVLESLVFKSRLLSYVRKEKAAPAWTSLADEVMQTRRRESGNLETETAKDLLQKYIDGFDKNKDHLPPDLLKAIVSSTISAGFDTTAFTMTTMLYYLVCHPKALNKLQQEVEDAVANGSLSNPPRYTEAERLPYLSAAMKEAMRCYPFLTNLLERVVPPEGVTIGEKWIPGGTVVGCHATIVHRDPEVFGNDANEFRPERWLTEDKDQLLAMERGSLGFGSGKRVCLGRHIAEMEIKKVIPALLLRFKIGMADPTYRLGPVDRYLPVPKSFSLIFEERE